MKARSIVIAIDGPAAAGKGTLARRIAEHLGYAYLDTGLIYRAVGHKTIESGADPGDVDAATSAARALVPEDLTRPELRGDEAANAASKVAAFRRCARHCSISSGGSPPALPAAPRVRFWTAGTWEPWSARTPIASCS